MSSNVSIHTSDGQYQTTVDLRWTRRTAPASNVVTARIVKGTFILSRRSVSTREYAADNKADKDAAYIRANGVPGVFKVVNDLQVAGEGTERK